MFRAGALSAAITHTILTTALIGCTFCGVFQSMEMVFWMSIALDGLQLWQGLLLIPFSLTADSRMRLALPSILAASGCIAAVCCLSLIVAANSDNYTSASGLDIRLNMIRFGSILLVGDAIIILRIAPKK